VHGFYDRSDVEDQASALSSRSDRAPFDSVAQDFAGVPGKVLLVSPGAAMKSGYKWGRRFA